MLPIFRVSLLTAGKQRFVWGKCYAGPHLHRYLCESVACGGLARYTCDSVGVVSWVSAYNAATTVDSLRLVCDVSFTI